MKWQNRSKGARFQGCALLLMAVTGWCESAVARSYLNFLTKEVVIVDAPKGGTSSTVEGHLGLWIDDAAKALTLADGTPLTVNRFDDHWISATRANYEGWRCNDYNWIRTVRNCSRSDEIKKTPLSSAPLRINFVIADSNTSIVNVDNIYMNFREAVGSLCSALTHEDVANELGVSFVIRLAENRVSYYRKLIEKLRKVN